MLFSHVGGEYCTIGNIALQGWRLSWEVAACKFGLWRFFWSF